jgi:L-arabinokinase
MNRSIHVGRAPGRLDIMGGNDDYTGGLVFEATIREATWAAVALRDDERIALYNSQMADHGWRDRVEFGFDELTSEQHIREIVNRDSKIRWTAYVIGIFYFLRRHYADLVLKGADVYIRSDVPLNKGVSSSAAVEVAVMKAAAHAYGIDLRGIELAEACQWVENEIAESACGIMDQIAVVLGDEAYIVPVVCQPCILRPPVQLPAELNCWGVDSGVRHAVTGLEYETARAAAFMGYKLICDFERLPVQFDNSGRIPRWTDFRWNGYLANISPSLFRARYESRLPELISGSEFLALAGYHVDPFTKVRPNVNYRVRANTRYAVEENARVKLFAELARRGTGFIQMGELMYQSHLSYSECGLGCDATDLLVKLVRGEGAANGLYGAKITGGGAGGTVAILGRKDAHDAFHRVVQLYATIRGQEPYVFEGSSVGADGFGVHVFPE